VVTVKHPESNKPKPTVKKNKPIQADLDVAKEFTRCKEEGISRFLKIIFLYKIFMFC
jgi:leucine-rich repeat protein SHOC2